MSRPRWVTVFQGPPWQVEILQGLLESEGIVSSLPDRATKIVDPFITGGNPLLQRLTVRPEDAQRATHLIQNRPEEVAGASSAGLLEEGDAGAESGPAESDEEALEHLAMKTRWSALLGLTAPAAVFYGTFYWLMSREIRKKAVGHRLTMWAFVIGAVESAALVAYLVAMWTRR